MTTPDPSSAASPTGAPCVAIAFPPAVACLIDRATSPRTAAARRDGAQPYVVELRAAIDFARDLDERARLLAAAARIIRLSAGYPTAAELARSPEEVRRMLATTLHAEWTGPLPAID